MYLNEGTLLQGGAYKIVRFIKSGGFGCTYEAMHLLLNKRVAIKEFFVKDFCNREDETGRITVGTVSKVSLVDRLKQKFIDEASGLSALDHEGIVNVSNLFLENGTAYYVMDYIDGCSLDVYIQQNGPLTESAALDYIGQACDALKYVHDKNILHLDIKPGNLMLDKEGKIRLIDFGTSKQYDECDGENTSTLLGNTPGYAPPEQSNTKVSTFTPATDVYSLGATLYKLLTGVTPPTANERSSGEELEPLPETVSSSTSEAIMKAMRLNKKERLQSIDEFKALLMPDADAAVHSVPDNVVIPELSADNDSTVYTGNEDAATEIMEDAASPVPAEDNAKKEPEKKPKRRRWGLWVLICVVLTGLIGAGVVYFIFSSDDEEAGSHMGYEYVDLGLPSGVMWATCNVGAANPEDYGEYYAWGAITPDGSNGEWMEDIDGNPERDVATSELGGNWRMPTLEEIKELKEYCNWEFTERNGQAGYTVTGPNGNSIFLPASGYQNDDGYEEVDRYSIIWSSTPFAPGIAYALFIGEDWQKHECVDYSNAVVKFNVRPVISKTSDKDSDIYFANGTLYVNGVEYPMITMPGGYFNMGSERSFDERPCHEVYLTPYRIGQFEVTQDIWKAVMDSNPSKFKGDRLPVENVSWNDCIAFIDKLNSITGQNFTLPTEAQWECAAKTVEGEYTYSGSDDCDDVAVYDCDRTYEVGSRASNDYGLYDMSGNVWEWCSDNYGEYDPGDDVDPQGPSSGETRVLRGGSWDSSSEMYCTTTYRNFYTPDIRSSSFGFRLCL